jgi:hypothetical protein
MAVAQKEKDQHQDTVFVAIGAIKFCVKLGTLADVLFFVTPNHLT